MEQVLFANFHTKKSLFRKTYKNRIKMINYTD